MACSGLGLLGAAGSQAARSLGHKGGMTDEEAPVDVGCQGLGDGGIPGGLRAAEGVAEVEELAQAGDEGHLGRLAGGDQALVEGLDAGVVAGGRQRGHGERAAHLARGRPSSGGARAGCRCRD